MQNADCALAQQQKIVASTHTKKHDRSTCTTTTTLALCVSEPCCYVKEDPKAFLEMRCRRSQGLCESPSICECKSSAPCHLSLSPF